MQKTLRLKHSLYWVENRTLSVVRLRPYHKHSTVLAAHLTAAAVNDVGTGTGIAAVKRQHRSVRIIGQAGMIVCIRSQLDGKRAVRPRRNGNDQVGNAATDAIQRSFVLHDHIFMQGTLAVCSIQFSYRGLDDTAIFQVQLTRADGLAEPLAALRFIFRIRLCLQPRSHNLRPSGARVVWVA